MSADESEIAAMILRLVAERGAHKTVCPSEVARALVAPGTSQDIWSKLMQPVRRVAIRLAGQGEIAILRKGKPVADPAALKGIYRVGLPRNGA